MRVAVVGCGNIAPFYFSTLHLHPELQVVGVMDRDQERATRLSHYYQVRKFDSLEQLLADDSVELVINLTSPSSHFAVSKACLDAGKHVYSEKPLAMSFCEAEILVRLAEQRGLHLSSAPSRVLADTAQTMWKALRENAIGTVRAAYAEMDGGLVHLMRYKDWRNELDVPWSYMEEFQTGCTLEHAAYQITWLMGFFGPVESVTAFASCQIPDKLTEVPLKNHAPDFSVAGLKFASGPVARLTCSWIAPHDHSMRIFGDNGILCTDDVWRPRSPVYIRRSTTIKGRTLMKPWKERYALVGPPKPPVGLRLRRYSRGSLIGHVRARLRHLRKRVDFCLGPAELAAAVAEQRPPRLSANYCLHATEVMLAIHNALETGSAYTVQTRFDPITPMPWAQ